MLNKIVLIGRLTKDVELKMVGEENIPVATFTLAVNRRYKNKSTGTREADFIQIRARRKTAEIANTYLKKGKQVYVCGSLETYSYEKDGERRYSFHVVADEIGFADSNGGGNEDNSDTKQAGDIDSFMPVEGEDLPF